MHNTGCGCPAIIQVNPQSGSKSYRGGLVEIITGHITDVALGIVVISKVRRHCGGLLCCRTAGY